MRLRNSFFLFELLHDKLNKIQLHYYGYRYSIPGYLDVFYKIAEK